MRCSFSLRRVELSVVLTVTASVCLAQSQSHFKYIPPDAGSYSARVLTASGQVSLFKDPADFRPVALTPDRAGTRGKALSVGDLVQVTQTIVTGPDGHTTLQISDGSTIEVFPNSNLVFRKNTGDWKDLLDLIIGSIRVHIEHFGNAPNPNRIMTPTAVISVRGTTFDVSVDSEDETTEVDVEEGTVAVDHALLPTGRTATLHDGESIKVYKNVPLGTGAADKVTIMKYVLQALRDAALTLGNGRTARINLPGGGGGGGLGDSGCKPGIPGCAGTAPPPPPTIPPPTTTK